MQPRLCSMHSLPCCASTTPCRSCTETGGGTSTSTSTPAPTCGPLDCLRLQERVLVITMHSASTCPPPVLPALPAPGAAIPGSRQEHHHQHQARQHRQHLVHHPGRVCTAGGAAAVMHVGPGSKGEHRPAQQALCEGQQLWQQVVQAMHQGCGAPGPEAPACRERTRALSMISAHSGAVLWAPMVDIGSARRLCWPVQLRLFGGMME